VGESAVDIGVVVDPLSAAMLVMVSLVGFLIFVYSTGYMHEDSNYTRFFCFVSLFASAMLGLVISNSMLLMFLCWEIMGLCSYLLIGFWFFKPSAANAAKKAFIVTRVGDVGFFIGLLVLYAHTGTLVLHDPVGAAGILDGPQLSFLGSTLVNLPFIGAVGLGGLAAFLLFCGAMGKSAQFPLHVWLPDAMEGPTSVSALIHAATMVAAGVFMVARMYPIFELGAIHGAGSAVMTWVMWIGAFTALFAATIAVAQNDIKRVLAYSTISQLGYMMLALGAGGYVAGVFHLLTHAFFKALLFMGSGSVIHGCSGEQDMFKMGAIRKEMPTTFITYLLGTFALVGIFPFAGFWSKDEVLLDAFHANPVVYYMGSAAAFLTAFYMFRQIYLVFYGTRRSHDYHVHESPPSMLWPLRILAFFAVTLGVMGLPYLLNHPFHHFLAPGREGHPPNLTIMISSTVIAVVGILAASILYLRPNALKEGRDPLRRILGPIYTLLERKYFMDELYELLWVRGTKALASLFRGIDTVVIDGTLHFVGRLTLGLSSVNQWIDNFFINDGFDEACKGIRRTGRLMSAMQTGRAQDYLRYVTLGVVLMVIAYYSILA